MSASFPPHSAVRRWPTLLSFRTGLQLLLGAAGIAALLGACSAGRASQFGDDDGSTSGAGADGTGGGIDLSVSATGSGAGVLGIEPPCEGVDPNVDSDGDGWTGAQGDCNDCTAQMNPGALDYAGNQIDEDCNGADDDTVTVCDTTLAVGSTDAMDAARAMDLCHVATGEAWGVVSAQYLHADGTTPSSPYFAQGHGILSGFGPSVNPQAGGKLFAISSGAARQPTDVGYESPGGFDKGYITGAPAGYPKESPACPGVVTGTPHDSIALRMTIKTPTNAKSLRFNVNMYTYEFPDFICSTYNDFIVAILSPTPAGVPENISFDTQGNPLSVNAGFLEVCACNGPTPCTIKGKVFNCALGTQQLTGTGFEGHAATGWLQTTAPLVDPGGNITIDFAAWDSGDGILDTTGLFDNFAFEVEATDTVTAPVQQPK